MKDLSRNDILKLKEKTLNRVSLYINGRWRFVLSLGTPVRVSGDAFYYKMNTRFGISYSNKKTPDTPYLTGNSGDYVVVSPGNLGVITNKEYSIYFPKQNNSDNSNSEPVLTSESLKDPNFLTNIIKDNK